MKKEQGKDEREWERKRVDYNDNDNRINNNENTKNNYDNNNEYNDNNLPGSNNYGN